MLFMGLTIEEREREGVNIFDVAGRLMVGQPAAAIREKIAALAAGGSGRVVLNMAGVDYIDSTGLGTLVVCFTTLQKAGGRLTLCNLNRRNLELLVLTKLSAVFDIYTDEQDALNSYFPNREIKRFDILAFVQQQKKDE